MKSIRFAILFAAASASLAQTQADNSTPKVLLCDENAGCAHQFIEGQKFKILTSDGLTVIVSMALTEKYTISYSFLDTIKRWWPLLFPWEQFGSKGVAQWSGDSHRRCPGVIVSLACNQSLFDEQIH